MRVPRQLQPIVSDGLIDEVVRPLMTGKEASVYLVVAHGELCCAKAYKDASQRSFKNRADYQEGRRTRNSRRGRAMQRGSKFGKREQEDDWQNAEVDALYRLAAAGVRVPRPLGFSHGVLVMELITGDDGDVAPRLNDVALEPEVARSYFKSLLADVVKMLCAGLVHGDLSEYNVLVAADGPVIIDLPQVIDAAANNNAPKMLRRDVSNLGAYFSQFAPELGTPDYGREIWQLYQKGKLLPDTKLTGRYEHPTKKADVGSVLQDIDDAREDAQRRQGRSSSKKEKGKETWRGVVPDAEPATAVEQWVEETVESPTGNRRVVNLRPPTPPKPKAEPAAEKTKRRRRRRRRGGPDSGAGEPGQQRQAQRAKPAEPKSAAPRVAPSESRSDGDAPAKKRRRRRRRGSGASRNGNGNGNGEAQQQASQGRARSQGTPAGGAQAKPAAPAESRPRRRRKRLRINREESV